MIELATPVMAAVALSIAIMAVTEYLVVPLRNTPKIAAWLVKIGLAYPKDPEKSTVGDNVTIWVIPYITFLLGAVCSFLLKLDIMASILSVDPQLVSRLISAAVIGGGSAVIHRVAAGDPD